MYEMGQNIYYTIEIYKCKMIIFTTMFCHIASSERHMNTVYPINMHVIVFNLVKHQIIYHREVSLRIEISFIRYIWHNVGHDQQCSFKSQYFDDGKGT